MQSQSAKAAALQASLKEQSDALADLAATLGDLPSKGGLIEVSAAAVVAAALPAAASGATFLLLCMQVNTVLHTVLHVHTTWHCTAHQAASTRQCFQRSRGSLTLWAAAVVAVCCRCCMRLLLAVCHTGCPEDLQGLSGGAAGQTQAAGGEALGGERTEWLLHSPHACLLVQVNMV